MVTYQNYAFQNYIRTAQKQIIRKKKRIGVDAIKDSVKQTFHMHLVGSLGLCTVLSDWNQANERCLSGSTCGRAAAYLSEWPDNKVSTASTSTFHRRPHTLCTTVQPLIPLVWGVSSGYLEGGNSKILGNYVPIERVPYPCKNPKYRRNNPTSHCCFRLSNTETVHSKQLRVLNLWTRPFFSMQGVLDWINP